MMKKHPKNYIKEIREIKGISAEKLAEMSGVSGPFITMLENGNRGLTLSTLNKIANALGVHPADLTDGPSSNLAIRDDKEKSLISTYRMLDDSAKQIFHQLIKSMQKDQD